MTLAECTCRQIQAADPLRHFTGCPLREPLPAGHPQAVDPLAALFVEVRAEVERVDSDGHHSERVDNVRDDILDMLVNFDDERGDPEAEKAFALGAVAHGMRLLRALDREAGK